MVGPNCCFLFVNRQLDSMRPSQLPLLCACRPVPHHRPPVGERGGRSYWRHYLRRQEARRLELFSSNYIHHKFFSQLTQTLFDKLDIYTRIVIVWGILLLVDSENLNTDISLRVGGCGIACKTLCDAAQWWCCLFILLIWVILLKSWVISISYK